MNMGIVRFPKSPRIDLTPLSLNSTWVINFSSLEFSGQTYQALLKNTPYHWILLMRFVRLMDEIDIKGGVKNIYNLVLIERSFSELSNGVRILFV